MLIIIVPVYIMVLTNTQTVTYIINIILLFIITGHWALSIAPKAVTTNRVWYDKIHIRYLRDRYYKNIIIIIMEYGLKLL